MEDHKQHKNSTSEPMRDGVQFLSDGECVARSSYGDAWRVCEMKESPFPPHELPDTLYKWLYSLTNGTRLVRGMLVFDSEHHFNLGSFESETK